MRAMYALRMKVPLLYMKTMAKVLLGFTFDVECIQQWPLALMPAIRFEKFLGDTLNRKGINLVPLSIHTMYTSLSSL